MSPGATFERVYNELKRMLTDGELMPGTPIEPAMIGKKIASSITPVRDALHRLTGERLVEAPNHNGFRVPSLTEVALRDLYNWNETLLVLGADRMRLTPDHGSRVLPAFEGDRIVSTARLFVAIAAMSGNGEHLRAVELLNDRLASTRRMEGHVLDAIVEEHDLLKRQVEEGDCSSIAATLKRYHRRRYRAVPAIVAALAAHEGHAP